MHPAAPTPAEPERKVLTLPGGVTLALRRIPAGSFRMGSRGFSSAEEPIHTVQIEHDFWLGETPVTQAQFAVWTQAEGISHQNRFHDSPRPEHPAKNLDWRKANRFCDWLTRTLPGIPCNELEPDFGRFCLPTEAEWEYACRAGTDTEYYSGDGEAALAEVGWFGEDLIEGSTHPVGQKRANAFQLHDLHGNVSEWCHDVWDESAYRRRVDAVADPGRSQREVDWSEVLSGVTNEQDDRIYVMRGGSWDFNVRGCRSAYRIRLRPVSRLATRGFRVCLVPGPAGKGGAPEQPQAKQNRAGSPGGGSRSRGTRSETEAAGRACADPGTDLSRALFSGAAGRKNFPARQAGPPPIAPSPP